MYFLPNYQLLSVDVRKKMCMAMRKKMRMTAGKNMHMTVRKMCVATRMKQIKCTVIVDHLCWTQ
jgi:hypothetical protein